MCNKLLLLLLVTVVLCAKTDYEDLAKKYIAKAKKDTKVKPQKPHMPLPHKPIKPSIAQYDHDVMEEAASLAQITVLKMKSVSGSLIHVTLDNLAKALGKSHGPTMAVTTVDGARVVVSTQNARTLVRNTSRKTFAEAEARTLHDLMKDAKKNPKAAERLTSALFRKIYKEDPKAARQKAFARAERMMGLKEGTIYSQYEAGVKAPDVKASGINPVDGKIIGAYKVLNTMDLTKEQEIPDGLLEILNKDLTNKTYEEEKDADSESKLSQLKTFLFGKNKK